MGMILEQQIQQDPPVGVAPERRLKQDTPVGVAPERRLKFVFFPLCWVLAHVGRSVEVAKVLRERGHEVIFAGEDPEHPKSRLSHASAAGFRVVRVREPRWHYAWDRFHRYGAAVGIYDFFRNQQWAPLDEIVGDIVRVCEEEQPDCIVGDMSVGVSTAGHILELPAAGILNAYTTYFFRPGSFYKLFIQAWEQLVFSRRRARVYRRYGKEPVDPFELLRSIPLISPDLEEFHAPHGDYPNFTAVGPILSEPPASLPDWYGELGDGTPNIYITMGSTGLLESLLLRSYEALGRASYRFIVTTGNQVSQEVIDAAPANFRFASYAPGSKLLQHCEAIVFHGGNGTMYQALAAGTPMVALPSHLEQAVCLRTMLKHGFGTKRNARRIGGEDLLAAIEEVVRKPQYRAAAMRYRKQVQQATAAEKAADILERTAFEGQPAGARIGLSGNMLLFPRPAD